MKYKVGDLIQDKRYPEDGTALIIEIGDRRKRLCYKLYLTWIQQTDWFDKEFVEQDCEVIA